MLSKSIVQVFLVLSSLLFTHLKAAGQNLTLKKQVIFFNESLNAKWLHNFERLVDSDSCILTPIQQPNAISLFWPGPNKIKYFSRKDGSDLFDILSRGDTVKDSFIEELDLKHYINSNKSITVPLQFRNCIINSIVFGENSQSNPFLRILSSNQGKITTAADSIFFEKKVLFDNCQLPPFSINSSLTFNDSVSFINCDIDFKIIDLKYQFDISNSIFKGPVIFLNDFNSQFSRLRSFAVLNSTKLDSTVKWLYRSNFLPMTFTLNSCMFNKTVVIYNDNRYCHIDLSSSRFNQTFSIDRHGLPVNRFLFHNSKTSQNINLSKSVFTKFADFHDLQFFTTDFTDAQFHDTVDLYNSFFDTVANKYQLQKTYFGDNVHVLINPNNFDLDNLSINAPSAQKIIFPFVARDSILIMNTRFSYNKKIEYYEFLTFQTQQLYKDQPELLTDLKERYKHEALMEKMKYYKKEKPLTYVKFKFLEWTVGNGYKGELNFLFLTLIVVILFAIIYTVYFRKEVVVHFRDDHNARIPLIEWKLNFKNIMKCLWLSFTVFINPRFPRSYFNFKRNMFTIITLEWIIGVMLIVLFLIFIASKYAFIKALIGL